MFCSAKIASEKECPRLLLQITRKLWNFIVNIQKLYEGLGNLKEEKKNMVEKGRLNNNHHVN